VASKRNGSHDRLGRFTPGNDAYMARKRRLAELVQQLQHDFPNPTPSQRLLFPAIARALDDAEHARVGNHRVRASNVANRLLKQLQRKAAKPIPVLAELGL
jgi:hypothetical protein